MAGDGRHSAPFLVCRLDSTGSASQHLERTWINPVEIGSKESFKCGDPVRIKYEECSYGEGKEARKVSTR